MAFDEAYARRRIEESARTIAGLSAHAPRIAAIGAEVASCLARGGRVYTCGNGGSAAEALHLAEELIGKYRDPRRALGAVCLNADPTALTCIANDFGFEAVFSRQLEGLARAGDVLAVFTTSGASANVLKALHTARFLNVTTVGLLGKGGGPALALCDHALVVDSRDTAHIQEAHQVIVHLILEAVEGAA